MSKYALVKDGQVINTILWDGEAEADFGDGVVAVEFADDEPIQIGYLYEDGKFSEPPLTEEEQAQQDAAAALANSSTKTALMDEASQRISVLQDAVDLEMATDEEAAELPLWKKYRVLLSRIDANTADDITWPDKPE
ncbi:tail fiber assembly protein [Pantoea latae]|uniref:Phage tail protein n=1 Tax=Pantoea latae TaxID=1964541 RepID=A0A1V9DJG1_9GAMM|nr:tail fiber assembly protein [Pantoea latae]OQP33983.1 hypothetical protein B2J69_10215 [Pantoea latae]